jgi:hypothetical protein
MALRVEEDRCFRRRIISAFCLKRIAKKPGKIAVNGSAQRRAGYNSARARDI